MTGGTTNAAHANNGFRQLVTGSNESFAAQDFSGNDGEQTCRSQCLHEMSSIHVWDFMFKAEGSVLRDEG